MFMTESWNLDNIYTSSDSEMFKKDFESFSGLMKELNAWAEESFNNNNDELNKIEEYLMKKNELMKLNSLSLYVSLALSADTTNEKLLKLNDRLEEISSLASIHEVLFKKFIEKTDLDFLCEKSEIINEHKYILNEIKKSAKYSLSKDKEEMIAVMKTTGSVMWQKLWEQLTSTLQVEMEENDGKRNLPLSEIRNLAYSENAELRKKAYLAEIKAYEKIDKGASFALNGIKGEVISLSKMRGYKSVLEMTAIESRLDIEIIKTMFKVMKDYLPVFRGYLKKKAELLGHKNGLPFYDLFAPIGDAELKFSYEEAKSFIVENFSDFSEKLGSFAKNAFENSWIDVYPRQSKVGGAFCEAIHSIGESRILTNFTGSFNDVVTIAHELGHAYHDSQLYDESEMNAFYPMPIAETASTLCETIVTNAGLKKASEKEALTIIESDISSATQIVIDIFSRFIFEDTLIREREKGSLSVKELNEIMLMAQDKTYGDGLDSEYKHKYMWVCKPHYYDADFNYYNFPYAFGLLFSKGLYAIYKEKGEKFIPEYDRLLSISSKNDLYDVAKSVDIDLKGEEFWKKALDLLTKDIEKFYELCDNIN